MNKKSIQQIKMLFTVLFALFLTLIPRVGQAQSARVTLNAQNTTLEQIISQIEAQTSYLFVYNKDINLSKLISVNVENQPLDRVLPDILKNSSIGYKVSGVNLILTKKEKQTESDQPMVVSGRVVDVNNVPIIGATVMVKNTTTGVSSGVDGDFSISITNPSTSSALVFNYLGYDPTEILIGSRTNIDVTLRESSVDVDVVVVTALGIKRSEKALAYNAQTVDGDDLVAAKDANFINSLNGKVAGLNINASSSGVGGASKVVMRGSRSIEQSSNALYVIDGIPMSSFKGVEGMEFESLGSTESIADFNPEDIESMTILSGAAASALYGSNAANGAILITTKKGKAGQTSVVVSSGLEVLAPLSMPEFQTRYGTGDIYSGQSSDVFSWGNALNSSNYQGFNPSDDYLQTGVIGTQTVSFSTGTERNQTYLSAGAVNSRGVVPNNGYDRYNFTLRNVTSFLDEKMVLDVGANYIMQSDRNMVNQGIYSNPLVGAYLFPRGNDWNDVEMFERWDPSRNISTQYWPTLGGDSFQTQNPYWVNHRNLRENDRSRYMFNAALSYEILDWISISGRVKVDNSSNTYTDKYWASTLPLLAENSPNGMYGVVKSNEKQTYADALININKSFDDFTLQANIGASISDMSSDALKIRGPIGYGKLIGYDKDGNEIKESNNIPNVFNVFNLSNSSTVREQMGWREQNQSVFASVEMGYKGAYYLTLTGRNDWPSQLAGPNSGTTSYFYPSVGVSVVLSEIIPEMPKNLHYVKLRSSYAKVGTAFSRFYANPERPWNTSTSSWSLTTQSPLYNLLPEFTYSFEVGLTMRFLKKFNFDASYYDTRTTNQTYNSGIPASSQYSAVYAQSGVVRNRGVELSLGYDNTWGKFSWSSSFTASSNSNKILELGRDVINPITGEIWDIRDVIPANGGLGNVRFILREGGSLGDMYSRADLLRDSNGDIYVDAEDNLFVENKTQTKDFIKLGSIFPDANLAWRNDMRFGNFNFGFLITARLGGIVYSRTQAVTDYYGVSEASAAARDAGGIVINGNDRIDAYNWFQTVGTGDTVPQHYTYSGTNVRLQELSVGYTIPRHLLGNVVDMTFSLVGRNLFMIYNKAPFDPESVATTGNYYQGIDNFMMPSLRSIGFNVRLKF